MVYTFTKTTQWVRFHEVKQDVLLKISDIIEGYGAEVAFPTRTLHLPDGVRLSGSQPNGASDKSAADSSGKSAETSQNRQTTGDIEDSGDAE
jgi:MscS family membrane protein